MSERAIRFVCLGVGLGLLISGVVATFRTQNGPGAAALVTAGTAVAAGSLIWGRIRSFSFGGTSFALDEKLEAARILETYGEEEAAEDIRVKVVADLAPDALEARALHDTLVSVVADVLHDLEASVSYQELGLGGPTTIRPDLTFKTPHGRTIGVEVFVTRQVHNARVGLQRRIHDVAREDGVLKGCLFLVASPEPTVSSYITDTLVNRVKDWIQRSTPRLALEVQAINDLPEAEAEIASAIRSLVSRVDG